MEKDRGTYRILVIEDNPGDFLLVSDYIEDHILRPHVTHVESYQLAEKALKDTSKIFDIILLDLSLPDKRGEGLIKSMMALNNKVPIIALTGYSDLNFATRSISTGLADYLIKEDLTPTILYKSIVYNIERYRYIQTIKESERRYSDLFHLSPIPMWVAETSSGKFLDLNEAAEKKYGYEKSEFLQMTVRDIEAKDEECEEENKHTHKTQKGFEGQAKHCKKSGELFYVDLSKNYITYQSKNAELTLANDITERILHERTIESQNEKLKDIAWIQSHVVRAPVARMMGLINLIKEGDLDENQIGEFLGHVLNSADELDNIIKDVVGKSKNIKSRSEGG
ncbi:PAS domain S-box protein [Halocola ammonii]